MSEKPDGKTQFEEVGQDPTLNLAMRKDPRDVSADDLPAIVYGLRMQRAYIKQQAQARQQRAAED